MAVRIARAATLLLALLHAADGAEVVLIGLSNRQCNAARRLNLDGTVLVSGDNNLLDSPSACCSACKLKGDCNVWTYCAAAEGCDAGGHYRECALKQDWNVFKYQRVISNGNGWVSAYISTRCPGSDPQKLLALQRVNFPALTSQCQPGSSCTACMCSLCKAMTVANSEPRDLSLCLENFRTVMMFPTELGGSSLSTAAYQRLLQCPVADPPCSEQQSGAVFATLGPAVIPSYAGADVSPGCITNKSEKDCATACLSASGCDGFLYNALVASGRCCLKSGAKRDGVLSTSGDQFYYRMPAGTTAEDSFFLQQNPWGISQNGLVSASTGSSSSTPTLDASGTASSCVQTACGDTQPPSFTCSEQKAWGKCGESWMAPYCQATCGRCPCAPTSTACSTSWSSPPTSCPILYSSPMPSPSIASVGSSSPAPTSSTTSGQPCTCTDVQPNRYSCSDEARWGKCGQRFMQSTKDLPEGYCAISCQRCKCPIVKTCNCTDLQPFAGTTCKQHASWGGCGQEWMWRWQQDRPAGYCQITCGRCKC